MQKSLLSLVILSSSMIFNSIFPMQPCDPKKPVAAEANQAPASTSSSSSSSRLSSTWGYVRNMRGVKQVCDTAVQYPRTTATIAAVSAGAACYGGCKCKQWSAVRREENDLVSFENMVHGLSLDQPALYEEFSR